MEYVYCVQHSAAPLKHEASPVDPSIELHYRCLAYHLRVKEAARQVANP